MTEAMHDDLDWYIGTLAPAPAVGRGGCVLHRYLPEGVDPPLREDKAAAVLTHAGRGEGVAACFPTYIDGVFRRGLGGRKEYRIRKALFHGYLFLGVPRGSDPRPYARALDVKGAPVLTGFVMSNGWPARIRARMVARLMAAASEEAFDRTRKARRKRPSTLRPGARVTVATTAPYLSGAVGPVERVDAEGRVHLTIGGKRVSFLAEDVVEDGAGDAPAPVARTG